MLFLPKRQIVTCFFYSHESSTPVFLSKKTLQYINATFKIFIIRLRQYEIRFHREIRRKKLIPHEQQRKGNGN